MQSRKQWIKNILPNGGGWLMVMHPMVESKNHFKQIQGRCKMFRHFFRRKTKPSPNEYVWFGRWETAKLLFTLFTPTMVWTGVSLRKKNRQMFHGISEVNLHIIVEFVWLGVPPISPPNSCWQRKDFTNGAFLLNPNMSVGQILISTFHGI